MSRPEPPSIDPPSSPQGAITQPESIVLEALKVAYASTGVGEYLAVYELLRGRVRQRREIAQPVAAAVQPASAPGESPQTVTQAATPIPIRVVCATRENREGFFSSTALGRSLSLHRPADVEIRLFPRNALSLSAVYNIAIDESTRTPAIVLFVHDDVHLCDFYWADSLRAALTRFDVVGLAGNRRRLPMQPGWGHVDEKFTMDKRANLSGTVAHGKGFPPETIDVFGPSNQRVVLLDGLFLAARSSTLQAKSLRFDERFDFHFYDLDFCRQAEQAGLTMGTCPISVVHESRGGYVSEGWRRGLETYFDKWGD